MFIFKLELEDGTPADPPTFTAAVPNWKAGDTIPLGPGRSLRVVEVRDGLLVVAVRWVSTFTSGRNSAKPIAVLQTDEGVEAGGNGTDGVTPARFIRPVAPPRSFRQQRQTAYRPMSSAADPDIEALVRLEAACQLAIDALPKLPTETAKRLRKPIQELCHVTREELIRINPDKAKNFTRPAAE
jgi:hypothetical protein